MTSNLAPGPAQPPASTEQLFRAAFEQSVMGLVISDLDGVIQRANGAFCRIVMRTEEEVVGRTSRHMTHPDDQENNAEAIKSVWEGRAKSATYEKRYLRKDGSVVWTKINLSAVRDPQGAPESIIATIEDVTEQKRAQHALEEREEYLRLVLESIPDYAILTVDPDGIVTGWHSGAQRIFGFRAEEIIGRSADVLWTLEDQSKGVPLEERRHAGETGCAPDERMHVRKGGELFFASGVMRPMHDSAGLLRGFTKICRDVTAQQRAELELTAAKAKVTATLDQERSRLFEAFQRSPSFLAVLQGPEHVFELVNDAYYQLVGHRDVLGVSVRQALPEVAGQGFFEILDRVFQTGDPFVGKEMTVLLQRAPGAVPERRFVDLVYQPLRNGTGVIDGIFAHGVDITERKLAEEALSQQARTFDILLSAIKDYVFLLDRQGRFTYANKMLLDLWGLPATAALGKTAAELNYPKDVEEQIGRNLDFVYRTGETVVAEVAYTSPTGTSGHFEYILAPVHGADGQVESVAGTSRNISDRKRAEEEREQLLQSERAARAEAERAGRMKDEFLATLSHELRTPLNAILGWSNILRDDPSPEDITEGAEVIARNARAQAKIIEDLLDMSRIISGKVRLDVQRVDLAPVVEAAVGTVRPAAEAKGVRIETVLDPLARPVSGDPNRLQQVFWNLLSNAVKFTPRGGKVQVLLERVDSHLEVSVIDTGEGIGPEFLPHVFDRFRQADASTTRKHGGLGLGLAIVKQLIELHGGNVRVKSGGAGHGTTFAVSLPLTILHPSAEPEGERRHPQAEGSLPPALEAPISLRGVKVLVVDDEPDARALVGRLLSGYDAEIFTAASVEEAMSLVRQEKPDVLVSDIGMPGEDGYSLIRRVRAMPLELGGKVPAIALTAYARAEDRMKAVLAGFQMHITKPVEGAELVTMVASLAGRTSTL